MKNTALIFTDDTDIWLKKSLATLRRGAPLTVAERQDILTYCRIKLEPPKRKKKEKKCLLHLTKSYPASIPFISIYNKQGHLIACQSANGDSLSQKIIAVMQKIQASLGTQSKTYLASLMIDICILHTPQLVSTIEQYIENFVIGQHGLAIQEKSKIVFFKNTVAIYQHMGKKALLDTLRKKFATNYGNEPNNSMNIIIYETSTFRENRANPKTTTIVDLLYDKFPIQQSTINKAYINYSISLFINFYEQTLLPLETLPYSYSLYSNKLEYSNKSYAIIRKIAFLWQMITIAKQFKPALLPNLEKKFWVIMDKELSCTQNQIDAKSKIFDIGIASFALLALAEFSKNVGYKYGITDTLKTYLINSFDSNNENINEKELYFAPIAYIAIYKEQKEASLNNPIEKNNITIEKYYDYYRCKSLSDKPINWLSLYFSIIGNVPTWHIDSLKELVSSQQKPPLNKAIFSGSYFNQSSARVNAVMLETLIYAAPLLPDEKISEIENSINYGIRYLLQLQNLEITSFAKNSIGCFSENLERCDVRIDTLQHVLAALYNVIALDIVKTSKFDMA